MAESKERREAIKTFAEMIRHIPVAMLATVRNDGQIQSRPMVNVNRNFDGDLWFLTPANDGKADEIKGHPQVNVSFAVPSEHRYVSVSGEATLVNDPKRAELLWTDECKQWFPQDCTPSDLELIKVDVQGAEYWDAKRSGMVALGGMVRRVLSGNSTRSVDHDAVNWS